MVPRLGLRPSDLEAVHEGADPSIPLRIAHLCEIAALEGRRSAGDPPRLYNEPAEDDEKDGTYDVTAHEGNPMRERRYRFRFSYGVRNSEEY